MHALTDCVQFMGEVEFDPAILVSGVTNEQVLTLKARANKKDEGKLPTVESLPSPE